MRSKKKIEERKKFKEYIAIEDASVLDTKKAGIRLIADDEVFVSVKDTKNYWISNHGRLINDLRGGFYLHKTGNAHYTLTTTDDKVETYTDRLVAEHFLENLNRYDTIWHVDGDKDNCFYKNLIWVTKSERHRLSRGTLLVNELDRQQEYVPYIALKSNKAYHVWNGICKRCYGDRDETYEGAFMCELWRRDKDAFAEWWNSKYYECDGESMAVDKDLLFPGNKEYAPDKCCIIPQTLNTMLSNCKKHKAARWRRDARLPLGVRYDRKLDMYYGQIRLFGHDEIIRLSNWETPEEAFEEYKRHKQADILVMADKYKSRIPRYVYDALLKVDVKPF